MAVLYTGAMYAGIGRLSVRCFSMLTQGRSRCFQRAARILFTLRVSHPTPSRRDPVSFPTTPASLWCHSKPTVRTRVCARCDLGPLSALKQA
jgi:hypothetical protein